MLRIAPLFIALLLLTFHNLHAQGNASESTPVSIPGSRQLKFTSAINPGQEYALQVLLPHTMADTSKSFPVIYLLDSQWDFPLLCAISGEQYFDGFISDAMVVGITWGGPAPDYDQLRAKDFTPTTSGQKEKYGNAENFLACIKKELIPFIESSFPLKTSSRTLVGSSFGGLFTLYTMFKETNLFQHYVLTSPYTPWDNDFIYKVEKEYFTANKALPVSLYMAVGALENVNTFTKWETTLRSRNYAGLKMQTKILENIGHSGTKPEGYTRGVQWSFKRPSFPLSASELKSYVGKYFMDKDTVQVAFEDNGLVAISGANKSKLQAESPQDFYIPGAFLFLHFIKDKGNKVHACRLTTYRGEAIAKKIE